MKNEPVLFSVIIGRFQPITNAHLELVKQASPNTELIFLVGSASATLSLKNPFPSYFRIALIKAAVAGIGRKVHFIEVPDSAYNVNAWVNHVTEAVENLTRGGKTELIGHKKDDSSFYLDYFPKWDLKLTTKFQKGLSATEIRDQIFGSENLGGEELQVPPPISEYIKDYYLNRNQAEYERQRKEYKYLKDYRRQWENSPYPPVFVTTDAVVHHKGQILLVTRGRHPGKGLLALPGGFVSQTESIERSMLRELREETKIDVGKPILKSSITMSHIFDHPKRDPRGRTISHVYFIDLSDRYETPPRVRGADDAEDAQWYPINTCFSLEDRFFLDHAQIIKYFLGRSM